MPRFEENVLPSNETTLNLLRRCFPVELLRVFDEWRRLKRRGRLVLNWESGRVCSIEERALRRFDRT